MNYIRVSILLLILGVASLSFVTTKPLVQAASINTYERLFYYREGPMARASFLQHADQIDVLAPQAYELDRDGNLTGAIDTEILNVAQSHHIKIMPLITNGKFSQSSIEGILGSSSTTVQDKAIAAMVAEARKYNYAGWQIDFEQMNETYKDSFSAFINKFGVALRQEGLTSSVAVIAKTSDIPSDYPKKFWPNLIGVYDYASLAISTDFISLMSYDDPISKGPVARYSWLKEVLSYSLQHVPASKLSLGIPLYYWKRDDASKKIYGIGGQTGIETAATYKGMTTGYNEVYQAAYMKFKKDGRAYTLWYENQQSIQKKIELITKNKLRGFSAWAIGLEVSGVYNAIRK